jgi:hypothetical protein
LNFGYEQSINQSALAWKVSLHPNLKTYAAAGGSSSVTIHTALPSEDSDNKFGDIVQTMNPGRAKFGTSLAHVSELYFFLRCYTKFVRLQMEHE